MGVHGDVVRTDDGILGAAFKLVKALSTKQLQFGSILNVLLLPIKGERE